jgi:Cft2 family RNA processing exonuclease
VDNYKEAEKILIRNGIELNIEGLKVYLDPKKAKELSFVSHAHSDHCPRSFTGSLIASRTTCALMRREPLGECWHRATEVEGVKFSLHDSGHIPGSKQLLIENGSRILYTGDLNLNGGFITEPAETPKCDILIIEATFGKPMFLFPDKEELAKEMRDWASQCHSKNITPVFLGYSLGKAQELTRIFSERYKVYVEDSVYRFNNRAEGLGIRLGPYKHLDDFSKDSEGIIIAPPHKAKNFTHPSFRLALASGWTTMGWKGKYSNQGFALSDHCDYNDLIRFVEKVSPQVVYTTHGYAAELSRCLREKGFYSEPLSEVQTKLDQY